jgi:predicted RNase H-like nuclease (RuvC/YqgF family)
MPEENENAEQVDSGTEETVEETATDENGTESTDDAQAAETGVEEKPFDRKKFEAELRKKNSEAANLRKRLKEQEPLLAELQSRKDAEKSDTDRLNDQLANANEQITKTRQKLVRTQVQALAMTGFADPEDAVGALDLDSYIDSDGDIDEAAIKADLQALLERKPHWAKSQPQEGPRRPAPDRTQASGANKSRPPAPGDEFAGWLKPQLKSK